MRAPLGLWAILPLALLAAAGQPRCSTETGWQTHYGPVPTRTVTSTVRVTHTAGPKVPCTTVTVTSFRCTTITKTASATVVTTPTSTSTVVVNSTGTTTSTATTTVTTYLTTVTTSPTTTQTVQPSPFFTPIASGIRASGCTPTTSGQMRRRTAAPEPPQRPKKGPTQVKCTAYKTVNVTTHPRASYTSTVTVPGIHSSTVTTTSTVTSTAPATTTVYTQTNPVTETATTTSTTTSTESATTVTVPGPTYYAACGASNLVNYVNGYNVGGFRDQNTILYGSGEAAPYDCCVYCLKDPSCGAGYAVDYGGGDFACTGFSIANGTCDGTQTAATFHAERLSGADGGQYVFNSNCGQFAYGGVE